MMSTAHRLETLIKAVFHHPGHYHVGNWELLSIKLALEALRHQLEGAEKLFVVWTDNKNLAYMQNVERLNSRQARWALFFS